MLETNKGEYTERINVTELVKEMSEEEFKLLENSTYEERCRILTKWQKEYEDLKRIIGGGNR